MLLDAQGNLCVQVLPTDVTLTVPEGLVCVSPSKMQTEAGVASFLIRKEKGVLPDEMTINAQLNSL